MTEGRCMLGATRPALLVGVERCMLGAEMVELGWVEKGCWQRGWASER